MFHYFKTFVKLSVLMHVLALNLLKLQDSCAKSYFYSFVWSPKANKITLFVNMALQFIQSIVCDWQGSAFLRKENKLIFKANY